MVIVSVNVEELVVIEHLPVVEAEADLVKVLSVDAELDEFEGAGWWRVGFEVGQHFLDDHSQVGHPISVKLL